MRRTKDQRNRKFAMSLTEEELARRGDFERQYRDGQRPAVQAVEGAVCGCDYGGTSWATRAEANQITGALDLGPGVSLLEVGAGSGWPATWPHGPAATLP